LWIPESVVSQALQILHSSDLPETAIEPNYNQIKVAGKASPMTTTINIPETTDQFTELLQRVQAGEEILLAQNGVAIAWLLPIEVPTQPRIPGQDKGKVSIAANFNAPLPDHILNDFLNFSLSTP
jgi:antitoxin (DNA-binding transcriptional repressor) of toxin-antitoxin stability system